jgi:dienelactone hydrolase
MALAGCVSTGELNLVPAQVAGQAGAQGQGAADGGQLWFIPSPIPGLLMRATLFRPKGAGPFPLAVINHGSEQDASARALAPLPAFPALTAWFLDHGYAVLVPERPGHGKTGGRYLEDQGTCSGADYVAAGNGAADSIAAAVKYMTAEPFIKPSGIVLAGNSAGAWGALALAARQPAGVRAVVDFAGGRGGHDGNQPLHNCSPDRLVAAAGTFGATTHVPTLWLYAENDTYFPPDLSGRMADAYRSAGGGVEYHLLPTIAGEGHSLIATAGPSAPWVPYLDAFLRAH